MRHLPLSDHGEVVVEIAVLLEASENIRQCGCPDLLKVRCPKAIFYLCFRDKWVNAFVFHGKSPDYLDFFFRNCYNVYAIAS